MTTTAPTSVSLTEQPTASRLAGGAALVKAATYVVGFGVMGLVLVPNGYADAVSDPAGSLAFLRENEWTMYSWYLVLYLLGGFALIALVVGLDARLDSAPPLTRRTAAVVGHVWAGLLLASGLVALVGQRAVIALADSDLVLATSTWSSVSVVQDALGGGIEIVGAVWVVLVSVLGWRTGRLGRGMSTVGVATGLAGSATLVPAAADAAGSVFGLGFIVWFVWLAATLLRDRP